MYLTVSHSPLFCATLWTCLFWETYLRHLSILISGHLFSLFIYLFILFESKWPRGRDTYPLFVWYASVMPCPNPFCFLIETNAFWKLGIFLLRLVIVILSDFLNFRIDLSVFIKLKKIAREVSNNLLKRAKNVWIFFDFQEGVTETPFFCLGDPRPRYSEAVSPCRDK